MPPPDYQQMAKDAAPYLAVFGGTIFGIARRVARTAVVLACAAGACAAVYVIWPNLVK